MRCGLQRQPSVTRHISFTSCSAQRAHAGGTAPVKQAGGLRSSAWRPQPGGSRRSPVAVESGRTEPPAATDGGAGTASQPRVLARHQHQSLLIPVLSIGIQGGLGGGLCVIRVVLEALVSRGDQLAVTMKGCQSLGGASKLYQPRVARGIACGSGFAPDPSSQKDGKPRCRSGWVSVIRDGHQEHLIRLGVAATACDGRMGRFNQRSNIRRGGRVSERRRAPGSSAAAARKCGTQAGATGWRAPTPDGCMWRPPSCQLLLLLLQLFQGPEQQRLLRRLLQLQQPRPRSSDPCPCLGCPAQQEAPAQPLAQCEPRHRRPRPRPRCSLRRR